MCNRLMELLLLFFRRLQRLDHLAKKFKNKCDIHEDWTDGKEKMLADPDYKRSRLNEVKVSLNCSCLDHHALFCVT